MAGKLFQNPILGDLSKSSFLEILAERELYDDYAEYLEAITKMASTKSEEMLYLDFTAQSLADNLVQQIKPESDSAVLVIGSKGNMPYMIKKLSDQYNLRCFLDFSKLIDDETSGIDSLLNDMERSPKHPFISAAKLGVLESRFLDSEGKPYAILIDDTTKDPISCLDKAESLKANGIKKVYIALEKVPRCNYDLDTATAIKQLIPLLDCDLSHYLPGLKEYAISLQAAGIEIVTVPYGNRESDSKLTEHDSSVFGRPEYGHIPMFPERELFQPEVALGTWYIERELFVDRRDPFKRDTDSASTLANHHLYALSLLLNRLEKPIDYTKKDPTKGPEQNDNGPKQK